MSESHREPEPRDPSERTLADRLANAQERILRPDDPPELREAAGWVDRLDDLVGGVERARTPESGTEPRAEAVREAVLARLEPHAAAPANARPWRRNPAPRRPWWQVAAPFVVAAGLAGLFFWQYRDGAVVPPPGVSWDAAAPLSSPAPEAGPAAEGEERPVFEPTPDEAPIPVFTLENAPLETMAQPAVPVAGTDRSEFAPMARLAAPAAFPAAAAAESLLVVLRSGPGPETLGSVRARWEELRPAVADTALAGAIERALATAQRPGEPR
jgi:hypothetical protein